MPLFRYFLFQLHKLYLFCEQQKKYAKVRNSKVNYFAVCSGDGSSCLWNNFNIICFAATLPRTLLSDPWPLFVSGLLSL